MLAPKLQAMTMMPPTQPAANAAAATTAAVNTYPPTMSPSTHDSSPNLSTRTGT